MRRLDKPAEGLPGWCCNRKLEPFAPFRSCAYHCPCIEKVAWVLRICHCGDRQPGFLVCPCSRLSRVAYVKRIATAQKFRGIFLAFSLFEWFRRNRGFGPALCWITGNGKRSRSLNQFRLGGVNRRIALARRGRLRTWTDVETNEI